MLPDARIAALGAALCTACAPSIGSAELEDTGTPAPAPDTGINPVDWSLVINELQASNLGTAVDPDDPDATPDWVEIYNPSTVAVPLGGLYISDDPTTPLKAALPDQDLAAGGFLVLLADDNPAAGPTHLGFKLSASGESVGLFTGDGQPLDRVAFQDLQEGQVAGRLPDGGSLALLSAATPGQSNNATEALEGR